MAPSEASGSSLKVEIGETWQAFEALESEWNRLLVASRANSVFLRWEWIDAWRRVAGASAQPLLVVIRDGTNALVGIGPFYVTQSRLFRVVPYRMLRVLGDYNIIGHRDAAFLNWRFRPDQVGRSLIATVLDRDSKELRAYAVVIEKEPGDAQFGDFLAGSPQDLGILLDAIVPALRARGFSSATSLFLGAPWVGQVLQAHGFAFRGAPRVVTVRANPNRVESSTILHADNWYMTPADRDF